MFSEAGITLDGKERVRGDRRETTVGAADKEGSGEGDDGLRRLGGVLGRGEGG